MPTKVLVVDDELDTLNLLRVLLELTGFEPITTLNSTEAITLAEVEKVDVALLDIMMPKLDGFQLCRMMREHTTLKDLPIIFVTAYDAIDLEERRREAGADHIVHKPINIDLLTTVISDIQQKRLSEQTNAIAPTLPKPVTEPSKAEVAEKPTATVPPVATPKPVEAPKAVEVPEAAKVVEAPKAPETSATPKPDEADKPVEAPKAAEPAEPKPPVEAPKPAVPASTMPMTFVSASNDDANEDTPAKPAATDAAETPTASEVKTTPDTKPTAAPTPPVDQPSTDESAGDTHSKTDTTPIKPHRPPTPQ